MNHWQLVIQDIWSVARYAMPVMATACFGLFVRAKPEFDFDEAQMILFAWAVCIVTTWLCMAGYL